MEHASAYYFSKVYIICYRKRQENTKFIFSFCGKTTLKIKKIFQNPARFSKLVIFGVNSPKRLVGFFFYLTAL